MERGRAWLKDALEKMGIRRPGVQGRVEGGRYLFEVSGKEAETLLGRKDAAASAQLVESLQYLLTREISEDRNATVVIDVAGFRKGRETLLEQAAERVASFVRQTGKALRIAGINSIDRRAIHGALTQLGGVRSESEGHGRMRRLRIWGSGSDRSEQERT